MEAALLYECTPLPISFEEIRKASPDVASVWLGVPEPLAAEVVKFCRSNAVVDAPLREAETLWQDFLAEQVGAVCPCCCKRSCKNTSLRPGLINVDFFIALRFVARIHIARGTKCPCGKMRRCPPYGASAYSCGSTPRNSDAGDTCCRQSACQMRSSTSIPTRSSAPWTGVVGTCNQNVGAACR